MSTIVVNQAVWFERERYEFDLYDDELEILTWLEALKRRCEAEFGEGKIDMNGTRMCWRTT